MAWSPSDMEMDYADLIDSAANFSNGLDLTKFDEPSSSPFLSSFGDIEHTDVLEIEYEDRRTDSPSEGDAFNTCPYIPAASSPQTIQSPTMSPQKLTSSMVPNLASSPGMLTIVPIGWRRPKKISGLKDSPKRKRQLSLGNSTSSHDPSTSCTSSKVNLTRHSPLPYHPLMYHPTSRGELIERKVFMKAEHNSRTNISDRPKSANKSENCKEDRKVATLHRRPAETATSMTIVAKSSSSHPTSAAGPSSQKQAKGPNEVQTGRTSTSHQPVSSTSSTSPSGKTQQDLVSASAPSSSNQIQKENPQKLTYKLKSCDCGKEFKVSNGARLKRYLNHSYECRRKRSVPTTPVKSSIPCARSQTTDETPSQRFSRKFLQRLEAEREDLKGVFDRGLEENFTSMDRMKEFFDRITKFSSEKVHALVSKLYEDELPNE